MAAEQRASVTRQLLLLLLSNHLLEGSTASLARVKTVHADTPHSPHTLALHFAEGSGVSQALLLAKRQVHSDVSTHFPLARCFLDCAYDSLPRMNLILIFS
jgi:hypothetical protein